MTGNEQTKENSQVNDLKDKGNKALKEGRYEDAISYYNKAIYHDPDNSKLYSNRSATYAHLQEYNKSLKDAEKAIELEPNWAKGYSRKGTALFFMERFKEAKLAYEAGLKIEPNNENIKAELEKCNQKIKSPALSQPLANPFAMPGAEEKLKSDPRIIRHMEEPGYQELLTTLKNDPKSLGKRLESPEVLEILSVLLGLEIKLPEDDDEDEDDSEDEEDDGEEDVDETEQYVNTQDTTTQGSRAADEHSESMSLKDTEKHSEAVEEPGEENRGDIDSETEENDFNCVDDDEALPTEVTCPTGTLRSDGNNKQGEDDEDVTHSVATEKESNESDDNSGSEIELNDIYFKSDESDSAQNLPTEIVGTKDNAQEDTAQEVVPSAEGETPPDKIEPEDTMQKVVSGRERETQDNIQLEDTAQDAVHSTEVETPPDNIQPEDTTQGVVPSTEGDPQEKTEP